MENMDINETKKIELVPLLCVTSLPIIIFVQLCAMKVCGGMEVYLHSFLILAVDGSVWSTSSPICFTLGKRAHKTH